MIQIVMQEWAYMLQGISIIFKDRIMIKPIILLVLLPQKQLKHNLQRTVYIAHPMYNIWIKRVPSTSILETQ